MASREHNSPTVFKKYQNHQGEMTTVEHDSALVTLELVNHIEKAKTTDNIARSLLHIILAQDLKHQKEIDSLKRKLSTVQSNLRTMKDKYESNNKT